VDKQQIYGLSQYEEETQKMEKKQADIQTNKCRKCINKKWKNIITIGRITSGKIVEDALHTTV